MSPDLSVHPALQPFHPLIRDWFSQTYRAPTEIQARSWPPIASGAHVLLSAPTGSGKTLCAFLWALNQLITGAWPTESTGVLYVSPLKALNNDIRRNLVHPLREIRQRFSEQGADCPQIRILTRSGDTPQRERRQMLRRPPEILITTPESLNLLLSSPRARENLRMLQTVILDEIHAIAADKRGTHLITALERLVLLSGEFQRVALSATVRPVERIAAWVGGYQLLRSGGCEVSGQGATEPAYHRRELTILDSAAAGGGDSKQIELQVRSTGMVRGQQAQRVADSAREAYWKELVGEIKNRIRNNRSTLIFTNTRRHAEKLARLINEGEDSQLAYAHHGSLSKEIRLVVERKLKNGELSAIVATSSLELGIDIGALDEVLLIQTPFSVSSTLQRIGRAGHGVGQVSRGRLYCTHGRDLLNAALMTKAVDHREIEEIHPVEAPLDLLAQIILSMTGVEAWPVDELYDTLRCSAPFHDLQRGHYQAVLEMLAGRYEDRYIRELKSRLSWERVENTLQAQRGALPLIYRSGGTIPDRGYYDLRIRQGAAKIGELDEEFVWERKVGDTFNLGTQNWKIVRIDSRNVEVVPWSGTISITPFWRAERAGRGFGFSESVALFLERWNDSLKRPEEISNVLTSEHRFDPQSAETLVAFLQRQRAFTERDLPHRHHLLVEQVQGPLARASFVRVILHTLWGSRVNTPFALALEAAWQVPPRRAAIEVLADDDCLLIIPSDPDRFSLDELLSLVQSQPLEELLRRSLEGSGFFGARFRENAGRALLLPRSNLDRRIPLWLTRMRAKKLLEGVAEYGEFPILVETWRSCLQDEFDLPSLEMLLGELSRGEIRRSHVRTVRPSPFAENITWIQTNEHMYRTDGLSAQGPAASGGSAVQADVIREILHSAQLRPRISPQLAVALQAKLQRTASGYAPAAAGELLDWVKERLLIEEGEWQELLRAMERDLHAPDLDQISGKLVRYRLPDAEVPVVSALEQMPRILRSVASAGDWDVEQLIDRIDFDEQGPGSRQGQGVRRYIAKQPQAPGPQEHDLSLLLGEWLRFYAPIHPARIRRCFGLESTVMESALGVLADNRTVVVDRLTLGTPENALEICDTENLEILLRLTRQGARPAFTALSAEQFPLFQAQYQGVMDRSRHQRNSDVQDLQRTLESLFGFPAPHRLWEAEILPARLQPYRPSWLDELLRASELQWFGCGRRRIAFCFASDAQLFLEAGEKTEAEVLEKLLPSTRGRFSFWDLVDHSGSNPSETSKRIWQLVWQGRLAADSFSVLRNTSAGGVSLSADGASAAEGRHRSARVRSRRRSYDGWRTSHPLSGSWFAVEHAQPSDPLEDQELARARVRQLLERYGILFRELLSRELPPLQWSRLFRTLRIMELSGEILSGYFFEGIPGLQFISHRGFRLLQEGLPDSALYWISAADPASPCGLGLPIHGLPPRLPTTHLVYHGPRLVLVSRRGGRELELRGSPDDPNLARYLQLFGHLLQREALRKPSIRVERINELPARSSPYKQAFLDYGFVEEYKGLILRAGY